MAAISVVAAGSASTGATASTALSIAPIGSATRADVLLMQLTLDNASTSVTGTGAGWTEISSIAQSTTGLQQRVYYKVRSNTEPASYTWTFSSAVHATLLLLDTRGVDTSVPVNAYSSGTSYGTSIVAPEVAAQTAGSMLVGFFGSASSASAISMAGGPMVVPSNGTASAGAGLAVALATETYATAGLTGTRTASGANAANIGQMVALTAANAATCFTDNFNRSSLGSDWVTSNSKGGFNPTINTTSNRLQLTQNTGNQATLAILQRLFPAAGNLVQVTFRHYAYPNSSGADGMVTIFSDALVNPVAGGSGGSLGYAQYSSPTNAPGFAGGWLGVGLDEYGNFSNPTENRYQGPGARANSITIRGPSNAFYSAGTASNYASGYPYLTSANSLSPGMASSTSSGGPGDYYRISIDSRVAGEQWVQVERSTDGTTYTTPVSYFNLMSTLQSVFGAGTQLPSIPTNFWLSFTGGTGGSTNFHELTNLQVCATRMVSASPVINHFRFEIPTSMNTCQAATIKVTACTAASPACSPLTGADAYVTLKPTGWVGGDSVTLLNGQATLQLAQTSSGTITPDIDRTKTIFPSMINSSTASDCVASGGTNGTATIPCSISVSQATSGFGVTFPAASFQSCADSTDITIKACNASYASTTKNLQYWFSYTDPSSGTLPVTLSTDNWSTTKTLGSTAPSSATNPATISASFNSSAQTKIRIKYADVGRITMNVRDAAATTVTGSGSAVIAPAGFSITAVKDPSGNANPGAADATGAKFVAAGAPFMVTAQAINGCTTPAVTPNFGQESTREGISLQASIPLALNLVLAHNPNLAVVNDFSFSNGVGTATVGWPEVGVLQLTPNLKSGNYMGAANFSFATSATTVGRFYADHFDVNATHACTSFTYDRQPFGSFTVTPMSADGKALQNYQSKSSTPTYNFSRAVTLTDSTGSGTVPQVAASNFNGTGIATLTGAAATYTFNTNPSAPVTASIGASDADNPASTGSRVSMPIRSGRVRMANAYGSELLDLSVPMWSEYYNGSYWSRNTADSCSTLVSPYVVFSGTNTSLQSNTCVWDSGNPGASGKGCAAAPTGAKANRKFLQGGVSGTDSSGTAGFAGNFNLWLKAPGAGSTGSGNKTITVTATVPDWLKYHWGSAVASPSAQASFNVFRSPLIYSRENY